VGTILSKWFCPVVNAMKPPTDSMISAAIICLDKANDEKRNSENRDAVLLVFNRGKKSIRLMGDIEAINLSNDGMPVAHYDFGIQPNNNYMLLRPNEALTIKLLLSTQQCTLMVDNQTTITIRFKENAEAKAHPFELQAEVFSEIRKNELP
jgi:hypothetical protein